MIFAFKRAGALASAAIIAAGAFATIAAGANAQDPAEAQTPEVSENSPAASAQAQAAAIDAEPQVRFVTEPIVQPLPVETEAQSQEQSAANGAETLRDLVSTFDSADSLSREMRCLAQAVYFESRGEPLAGQLAVARVVINRSSSASFPDDYCSVVTQRAQFSFVRGGHIPEPNRASKAWQRATAIARIAHRDLWESEAHDALYFHATYVRPRWARQKQARATIDSHIFYR